MEVVLRRISYAKYDDFIDNNINNFANINKDFFEKQWSNSTEDIIIGGKAVIVEIDVGRFTNLFDTIIKINNQNPMEAIDTNYAEMLYSCLTINSNVPKYILYEKEVWAYLNCFVFFDVVKKRFFPDEGWDKDTGRIKRVFFCDDSNIDRTGLRWLWALADATYDDSNVFNLTRTARQFIDPVKALYERTMGTNRLVFKAYIRAIELLNYDVRIKSSKFRSIIPTHIRNLATMKIYESYNSIEELAKIFASDIKTFLDNYQTEI